MTPHILVSVVISLFCHASLGGQADNYPFSVDSEKTPNGHRIVARNGGPAPVSVKVSILDSQSISTDRQFPIYVVVPPGGGMLYLGDVHPATPGMGYSFRTQYTWTLGDFNAAQAADAMYRLPYRDGSSFRIGQSPGGAITTHTSPDSQFAVDIPMPEGTPILAAREGTVIYTEANQVYGAQVPDMMGKANEIRIQHIDGTVAIYAHLAHGGVYVYPGQRVALGQQIGLAGSTGYSSGPHLHFAVQRVRRNGNNLETVSLPFQFFVGNPPVTFSPKFGMLATADYSPQGVIPGTEQQTQIAQVQAQQPQAPTRHAPQQSVATGNADMVVSLNVPAEGKTFLQKIRTWKWLAFFIPLALLFLWFNKTRIARQQRELRSVREPTLRSRATEEEPIIQGLSFTDKLILACGGDRQKSQRLMGYERNRAPNITDDEAAKRAWQWLQRDTGG